MATSDGKIKGPGKCPDCGVKISYYAQKCETCRAPGRQPKKYLKDGDIPTEFLVRGEISTRRS